MSERLILGGWMLGWKAPMGRRSGRGSGARSKPIVMHLW